MKNLKLMSLALLLFLMILHLPFQGESRDNDHHHVHVSTLSKDPLMGRKISITPSSSSTISSQIPPPVSEKKAREKEAREIHEMVSLSSTLTYWFVTHPTIANFTWSQGQTFGSTFFFLYTAVAVYLSVTLFLRLTIKSLPSFGPKILKPITAVHSLILCLLSLIMAIGCILSIISLPNARFLNAICFPVDIKPNGPLFFWAQVFYVSKLLEFGDTLLIILGKSIQRLSFLHVYHHSTVVVMCYLWLYTRQSMFPVALVTNSIVHVIMYGYYFLSAVGSRPRWKRLVTNCQIVQFVFSFGLSGWMLREHFIGSGCSGIWGWCFNAAFNASLLALFLNFHSKNYVKKTRELGKTD